MRTIAIVNQKGGTGKTTTAVNLGASLAEAGKKVLLVDLDPQSSASLWFGFKDKGRGLFDFFTDEKKFDEIIEKTKVERLDIIPSSPMLAGLEKALANEVGSETILKNKLQALPKNSWDYILFDCPPTLGLLALNALSAVKEVLVPVEVHAMALHGLVQLHKTISLVKERLNPGLYITGILACRVDFRTRHARDVLEQLRNRFDKTVYKSVIRENIRIAESPLYLQPVLQYDPKCHGTEDYRELAKEILKQEKKRA